MSEVNHAGHGRKILVLDVCPMDEAFESVGFSRPVYPLLHLVEHMLAENGCPVMTSTLLELLSLDLDLLAALQRLAFRHAAERETPCR